MNNLVSKQPIYRIVGAAMTAPSADNCQPWRFAWNGQELSVSHDPQRARHALNRRNHCSLLSLGGVMELIRIAASAEGLATNMETDESKPWLRVRFSKGTNGVDPLYHGIPLRTTDRRLYKGGSLENKIFDEVRADVQSTTECSIHWTAAYPEEFLACLLKCEEFVWDHRDAMTDLLAWVRFERRAIDETRDGMPWQNLGTNFIQSRVLQILRHKPSLIGPLKATGFVRQIRNLTMAQLKSSAGLICFSVQSPSEGILVKVGSLAMRVWLRLNLNGYGVQPMTLAPLSIFESLNQTLTSGVRPEYRELFARSQRTFAKAFSLPPDAVPVWMFRTGLSSPLPKQMRTLRLPMENCLKVSHGI